MGPRRSRSGFVALGLGRTDPPIRQVGRVGFGFGVGYPVRRPCKSQPLLVGGSSVPVQGGCFRRKRCRPDAGTGNHTSDGGELGLGWFGVEVRTEQRNFTKESESEGAVVVIVIPVPGLALAAS
jgi:hypothetical protein